MATLCGCIFALRFTVILIFRSCVDHYNIIVPALRIKFIGRNKDLFYIRYFKFTRRKISMLVSGLVAICLLVQTKRLLRLPRRRRRVRVHRCVALREPVLVAARARLRWSVAVPCRPMASRP